MKLAELLRTIFKNYTPTRTVSRDDVFKIIDEVQKTEERLDKIEKKMKGFQEEINWIRERH